MITTCHAAKQVARLIKARDVTEAEREVYVVSLGGFDTHTDENDDLSALHLVNDALESFVSELKTQGAWDKVTICEISDFGGHLRRTASGPIAWGSINFVMGGAVAGGQILEQYPDLAAGSPLDTGRGRLIPTLPWEAMWNGIAEDGVAPEQRTCCRT